MAGTSGATPPMAETAGVTPRMAETAGAAAPRPWANIPPRPEPLTLNRIAAAGGMRALIILHTCHCVALLEQG